MRRPDFVLCAPPPAANAAGGRGKRQIGRRRRQFERTEMSRLADRSYDSTETCIVRSGAQSEEAGTCHLLRLRQQPGDIALDLDQDRTRRGGSEQCLLLLLLPIFPVAAAAVLVEVRHDRFEAGVVLDRGERGFGVFAEPFRLIDDSGKVPGMSPRSSCTNSPLT